MYKLLVPTGLIALMLSALTLSAQVRQPLPQPAPATSAQKTLPPERGVTDSGKTAEKATPRKEGQSDKQTRRRRHSRVYLGVATIPVEDMSNRMKRKLKLKNDDGVMVVEVMPDSPAEEAGIRHGDIITHVNGKLVDDEDELCDDLNKLGPNKPVKLAVLREGEKKEITAELEEGPAGEMGSSFYGPEAGHGGMSDREHELMQRIDHLERRLYHLENLLMDMDRGHSPRR